eukprot:TRINITY_DN10874_c0_g1_i1.p1 TRINITY_DN10874_c0_g1~~TRINITY_DN10874_c0_g1_i1.p1  ORF type:complete len:202 (+),score=30.61 TRINITY_DN10874_c0_g1_i1:3-608(+)
MLLGKGKSSLRNSLRTLFLLKEFGRTGETLELPDTCVLEFPDADPNPKADFTSNRYKRFIVHISPDEGLYEGGTFRIEFSVLEVSEYPYKPPKAKLLTKIWHPNIDLEGGICHNYLKTDAIFRDGAGYSPVLGMSGVVTGILTLFYPGGENPDDPLNIEAANQYRQENVAFVKKAKEWTKNYATKVEIAPHCLAATQLVSN